MRKIFLAFALVAAFSSFAAAQAAGNVGSAQDSRAGSSSHVPALCNGCIFYGGDLNESDPNADYFANGNTLLVANITTYTAVSFPENTHAVITGIYFSTVVAQVGNIFDPDVATYDIRTGVSSGNGGTSVAHGTGPMPYAFLTPGPDGPCDCVQVETAVNLAKPFTVTPGTTYWFNLSPQCTNENNSVCNDSAYYFLANTTQESNGLHADAQPVGQMYFNATFLDYYWTNWCDPRLLQNPQQCARASFGLMGHM